MSKLLLTLGFSLAAVPALAQPMWQIADRWRCSLDLHLKLNHDGKNLRLNQESGIFTYDFAAGIATSPFGGQTADIGETHYYEGNWGAFNVIELRWGGHPYPVIIKEEDGAFWEATVSGLAGRSGEIWMAAYHCQPDLSN